MARKGKGMSGWIEGWMRARCRYVVGNVSSRVVPAREGWVRGLFVGLNADAMQIAEKSRWHG